MLVLPCPAISVCRLCSLSVGLAHASVGLCVQMWVHIWLRPVDDGAEPKDPLSLHLYSIHRVDSANGSHEPGEEIPCEH